MSGQGPQAPVLDVNWVFGFSKDVVQSVHSLTQRDRNALFFLSSHSGVIYDFEHRTQIVLQGHCNLITCCAVSSDRRWIVTGDCGDDSILVVWDSLTGMPVKTIFSPHPKGVVAVDISEDALYIATLGEADAVSFHPKLRVNHCRLYPRLHHSLPHHKPSRLNFRSILGPPAGAGHLGVDQRR